VYGPGGQAESFFFSVNLFADSRSFFVRRKS
jgi:hypothetical protein